MKLDLEASIGGIFAFIIVVAILVLIVYAISWVFMYIWNYLVLYFGIGLKPINIWVSFLIILLLSFLRSSTTSSKK